MGAEEDCFLAAVPAILDNNDGFLAARLASRGGTDGARPVSRRNLLLSLGDGLRRSASGTHPTCAGRGFWSGKAAAPAAHGAWLANTGCESGRSVPRPGGSNGCC